MLYNIENLGQSPVGLGKIDFCNPHFPVILSYNPLSSKTKEVCI